MQIEIFQKTTDFNANNFFFLHISDTHWTLNAFECLFEQTERILLNIFYFY